ncbi:MAG: glutathione binding-like protein [Halieaceae bacterium]
MTLPTITFWGLIASPYQLKMQALADFAGHRWQRWPDQGSALAGLALLRRLRRALRKAQVERMPARFPDMDEYPSVPFYSFDRKQFFYDSSGLALHLDQLAAEQDAPLLPQDPALRFVCSLIDEAFDEFGLYMVHHNRWVTSAKTNRMGEISGGEFNTLLPGLGRLLTRKLPARQVRRCPYLFSVAPAGFDAGVAPALTPPARDGFPPTHDLLDQAWRQYLAAMEGILTQQPYLLGDRFTLADASAYGQLSMNLVDGLAAELIEELAPATYAWLCAIRDGKHIGSRGDLYLSEPLSALLEAITETFVPLMQQNAAAYQANKDSGETLFNEAAFNRDRSLYDGELQGHPFRAVAKSFQVVVWQDLCEAWQGLDTATQQQLEQRYACLADAKFSGTS